MARSTRRVLIWGLVVVGFLALLNPGYSSVYIDGPTGVIRTEKYSFGPGSLVVRTRVVADDATVTIEQR